MPEGVMIVAYILFILFPQNLALVYVALVLGPVLHPEHLHSDDRYLGADRLH